MAENSARRYERSDRQRVEAAGSSDSLLVVRHVPAGRVIALIVTMALVACASGASTTTQAIGGWGDKRVCSGLERVYGDMERSVRAFKPDMAPADSTDFDSNRVAFIDTMLAVYEGTASLADVARPEIRPQFAALGDSIEPLRERLEDVAALDGLLRGDDTEFVELIGLQPAAVAIERWARLSCSEPVALTVEGLGLALTLAFAFLPAEGG